MLPTTRNAQSWLRTVMNELGVDQLTIGRIDGNGLVVFDGAGKRYSTMPLDWPDPVTSEETTITLNPSELNTVLAALRTYQSKGYCDRTRRPDWLQAIAPNSLDSVGIDDLCERLNLGGIA